MPDTKDGCQDMKVRYCCAKVERAQWSKGAACQYFDGFLFPGLLFSQDSLMAKHYSQPSQLGLKIFERWLVGLLVRMLKFLRRGQTEPH